MRGVRALYAAGKSYILMLGLEQCDSAARFRSLVERYYTPGLAGVFLIAAGNSDVEANAWVQRALEVQKVYPSLRFGCVPLAWWLPAGAS